MAAFFVAGCSPAVLLNELSPREGYDVLRSVSYGDGPRRTLDIYQPEYANGAPVVVFSTAAVGRAVQRRAICLSPQRWHAAAS